MPRRSLNNSDESPLSRRTSARIAAVQAASPVKTPSKTPSKTPRRKRQSAEPAKNATEDSESQQSQIKSESSIEEINGVETESSIKDQESVSDSPDLPPKKQKVDDVESKKVEGSDTVEVKKDVPATTVCEPTTETSDFEVIDKTGVPASDSDEVQAAVAVQGEGQILVGYVQVDKDELPVKHTNKPIQVPVAEEPVSEVMGASIPEEQLIPIVDETERKTVEATVVPERTINGESESESHVTSDSTTVIAKSTNDEVQTKVCPVSESQVEPSSAPAAGDGTIGMINIEPVPQ